jgi:hypothetical protein
MSGSEEDDEPATLIDNDPTNPFGDSGARNPKYRKGLIEY